jgi:microcompartment protein CcmL/EutN
MLRVLRSPILHIAIVVSLTLALAFAAAVGLTLAKFDRALADAVDARYRIHADDIRSGIETGINLGLGLDQIRTNVEELVTARIAVDEGILGIRITDASGRDVLAVSGPATADGQGPPQRQSLDIENSFGQIVGEVTLTYATLDNREILIEAGRILAANAAVLAGIAAAATSLCCIVVMAPIPRALRRVLAVLSGTGSATAATPDLGPVVTEAVDAAAKTHQVMTELATVAADLPAGDKSRAA